MQFAQATIMAFAALLAGSAAAPMPAGNYPIESPSQNPPNLLSELEGVQSPSWNPPDLTNTVSPSWNPPNLNGDKYPSINPPDLTKTKLPSWNPPNVSPEPPKHWPKVHQPAPPPAPTPSAPGSNLGSYSPYAGYGAY